MKREFRSGHFGPGLQSGRIAPHAAVQQLEWRVKLENISSTIERALASAGLVTTSGPIAGVTEAVRDALDAAGILQRRSTPDGRGIEIVDPDAPWLRQAPSVGSPSDAGQGVGVGRFVNRSFSNGIARRDYKLYIPWAYVGEPMPLLVMLHGCKQNPEDFASGTRMNALAEEHGFLVAYPAQTVRANGSNCWNWFSASEQSRGGEEPSLIAGISRDVGEACNVDEAQVFIGGLSAGAAMALITASSYPEVFMAVAVHSGLPIGAAHDVPSAFAAMQGRAPAGGFGGRPSRNKERGADVHAHPVRTIVFHGDRDATVALTNGEVVASQAVRAFNAERGYTLQQVVEQRSAGGRDCTVAHYLDRSGQAMVETWTVHGGSHAWSGGSSKGSYTDAKGPDASAEFVRFFLRR